jgi:hypothetical protein
MKKVTLTLQEFNIFKQLAKFYYTFKVKNAQVHIEADACNLLKLGF